MKGPHQRLLPCIVALLVILSLPAAAAFAQQPGGGVSGGAVDAPPRAGNAYTYDLLRQKVALWSDGRGDFILERTLHNLDTVDWDNTVWYFAWFPDNFSLIRAWDDLGPLAYSTSQTGQRYNVTVHFRRPIQPGESYHFFLAITIRNLASVSGNSGRANWYTYPGSPVHEFVHGVTFPSNATFQRIAPPPATQVLNYLEWRAADTPANWQQGIDVTYTMSSTIAVPLLLQTDPAWKNRTYANFPTGDTANTIGRWGSYLTSAAMIVNYWGQRLPAPLPTNPDLLNTWLKRNRGYDAGSLVIQAALPRYAAQNNLSLYFKGSLAGRNDVVLDDYLASGNPLILGVNLRTDSLGRRYPTHYVVATGKTTINGQATYAINDPIYGATTLLQKWNNEYAGMTLFSSTPADRRSLRIAAHSPVELLVSDPAGRRSGYDPAAGTFWNEIPDAAYFVDAIAAEGNPNLGLFLEAKVLSVNLARDGRYNVSVLGTGPGSFEVDASAADWTGRLSGQTAGGHAQVGSVYNQTIDYSSYTGVNEPIYFPSVPKQRLP